MPQQSAGLLMYRMINGEPEFFLVHPGGPFWAKRNEASWTIPKGLADDNEELLHAAIREFHEETGIVPQGPYTSLGSVKLKSGKTVHAWAFEGNWNPDDGIVSNRITIEWPPKSGKNISIPEVDRAGWMSFEQASVFINPDQIPLLKRAVEVL